MDDDTTDTDSDDDYGHFSEEYDSDEEDELSENELNIDIDSDDDDDANDNEDDEASSEEQEATMTSSPSLASGPPVKLSIKTALASPLLDQHLEFTASRTRTVLSLKQAISKTMRGRPPLSSISIKYQGRSLMDDDETVDDILEDVDSDEEESDDDEESDIGEEEDAIKVSLTCDIIPPVDAKFGIEFRDKITKMSTKEILEAYCVNMAGMVYGQELQAKEGELFETLEAGDDAEQDEDDHDAESLHQQPTMNENHSLTIRKNAARIQKQFESTLSEDTRQLIEEEHERVKNVDKSGDAAVESSGEVVYGLVPKGNTAVRSGRKGRTLKGGATMNVKRALQRNLNVNWADTTRNSLLFLFFGYFGGRNSFSRTFLLLSSPLCFFIQTRPVKVAMKQLFYTLGEPPGIFLSLLPAPQQAIMSLDYGGVMKGLYGEKVLEGEEWYVSENMEQEELLGKTSNEIGGGLEFDDGYDQYDDDDESDYDYDGDY